MDKSKSIPNEWGHLIRTTTSPQPLTSAHHTSAHQNTTAHNTTKTAIKVKSLENVVKIAQTDVTTGIPAEWIPLFRNMQRSMMESAIKDFSEDRISDFSEDCISDSIQLQIVNSANDLKTLENMLLIARVNVTTGVPDEWLSVIRKKQKLMMDRVVEEYNRVKNG